MSDRCYKAQICGGRFTTYVHDSKTQFGQQGSFVMASAL